MEGNDGEAVKGADEVYHLAADMGGIGYITGTHAPIARNNTRMNLHMLDAARDRGVDRFLFNSSAGVYPQYLQEDPDVDLLSEEDAWPAVRAGEAVHGEALRVLPAKTRVLRFHNVYGPKGA